MSNRFMVVTVGLIASILLLRISAYAVITGSKHDFSGVGWNTTGEICKVCHTPHNAGSALAPLWNHTLSADGGYTVYSSKTLNASVSEPSSVSKVCLSCHDGTVALNSFGGNEGYAGANVDISIYPNKNLKLGKDLSNDHPISFAYNAGLVTADDGGLKDPATTNVSALGGKTISTGMLYDGKVECSSCHDVHRNKGDSPNIDKLLLVNNAKSELCLTCHNK